MSTKIEPNQNTVYRFLHCSARVDVISIRVHMHGIWNLVVARVSQLLSAMPAAGATSRTSTGISSLITCDYDTCFAHRKLNTIMKREVFVRYLDDK